MLNRFFPFASLRKRMIAALEPEREQSSKTAGNILDSYICTAPSPQNAVDLFRGEWSSRFPAPLDGVLAGEALLFDDARMTWLEQQIDGFAGKTVLELGPLEGGHTYMLEKGGAESIVAVESNSRAFLKCLVVKELFGLTRSRFLFGDFVEYLKAPGPNYEICVASGVLYHMQAPAELIALLARRSQRHVLLWTHYYEEEAISAKPHLARKFGSPYEADVAGFVHSMRRYEYGDALGWTGFCGGSAPFSHWMTRPDILRALDYFGFGEVRINFDAKDHPNGPSFAVLATRR